MCIEMSEMTSGTWHTAAIASLCQVASFQECPACRRQYPPDIPAAGRWGRLGQHKFSRIQSGNNFAAKDLWRSCVILLPFALGSTQCILAHCGRQSLFNSKSNQAYAAWFCEKPTVNLQAAMKNLQNMQPWRKPRDVLHPLAQCMHQCPLQAGERFQFSSRLIRYIQLPRSFCTETGQWLAATRVK